jgi:hypothetical protein
MEQVVDPRAAAASVRVAERNEREPGDRREQRARLRPDPLRVREVAGVVVGNPGRRPGRGAPAAVRCRRAPRARHGRAPRSRPPDRAMPGRPRRANRTTSSRSRIPGRDDDRVDFARLLERGDVPAGEAAAPPADRPSGGGALRSSPGREGTRTSTAGGRQQARRAASLTGPADPPAHASLQESRAQPRLAFRGDARRQRGGARRRRGEQEKALATRRGKKTTAERAMRVRRGRCRRARPGPRRPRGGPRSAARPSSGRSPREAASRAGAAFPRAASPAHARDARRTGPRTGTRSRTPGSRDRDRGGARSARGRRAARLERVHEVEPSARIVHLRAEDVVRRTGRETEAAVDALVVERLQRRRRRGRRGIGRTAGPCRIVTPARRRHRGTVLHHSPPTKPPGAKTPSGRAPA